MTAKFNEGHAAVEMVARHFGLEVPQGDSVAWRCEKLIKLLDERPGASAPEFKPGDLVRHKTGGPVMCVVSVEEGQLGCDWWGGDNFYFEEFDLVAIAHHEPVDGDGIEQGEPETFQKIDVSKYPNLWDGPGPEANIGALGKPECRNCGMWRVEHDDHGVCPTGETVFKAEVD